MAVHAAETLPDIKLRLSIVAEAVFVVGYDGFGLGLRGLLINLLHLGLSTRRISANQWVSCASCIRAVYRLELVREQALVVALVAHFAIRTEWAHSVKLLRFAVDNYIFVHV